MISVPVTVAVENVSVPVTVNAADNSISMSVGANYHVYPNYSDGYEFTPSAEAQIIETAGKALDKDITSSRFRTITD